MVLINRVARAYSRVVYGLGGISGAIFGIIALCIGIDVVLRNMSGQGLSWVAEFAEYAMYVATVFAAPWVLREGGHVSVDVLKSVVPGKGPELVGVIAAVLGTIVCAIMLYYSVIATWLAFKRTSMIYKSFTIPEWWVSIFVPFCMVLMTIEFGLLVSSEVKKLRENNNLSKKA